MANQSLTITFTAQSEAELTVELDDTLNEQENGGRTSSFLYGDEVYFRVYTNPITGVSVDCYESDGVITSKGTDTDTIEETIIFTEPPESAGGNPSDNTASLGKPVYSGFSASALGNSLGSITVNPTDPAEVVASQAGPGVYEVSYTAKYYLFSLKKDTRPSGVAINDSYQISVVIVGLLEE